MTKFICSSILFSPSHPKMSMSPYSGIMATPLVLRSASFLPKAIKFSSYTSRKYNQRVKHKNPLIFSHLNLSYLKAATSGWAQNNKSRSGHRITAPETLTQIAKQQHYHYHHLHCITVTGCCVHFSRVQVAYAQKVIFWLGSKRVVLLEAKLQLLSSHCICVNEYCTKDSYTVCQGASVIFTDKVNTLIYLH